MTTTTLQLQVNAITQSWPDRVFVQLRYTCLVTFKELQQVRIDLLQLTQQLKN